MIVILSKLTGWGLAEILDEFIDDFLAWLRAAQGVQDEIAQQLKEA